LHGPNVTRPLINRADLPGDCETAKKKKREEEKQRVVIRLKRFRSDLCGKYPSFHVYASSYSVAFSRGALAPRTKRILRALHGAATRVAGTARIPRENSGGNDNDGEHDRRRGS